MKELTVGRLAEKAGVNIETVRYYERNGILPKPARKPSGYRLYSQEDVARLQFIIHAKALGFTLKEIKELLELRIDRKTNCEEVRKQAEEKVSDIEKKIGDLERMQKALVKLATACRNREPTGECPILEALEGHSP